MSNDTRRAHGRMCNHFIRNIICSELARKHNLKFLYGYIAETKFIGIDLFETGENDYEVIMYLHEHNIEEFLKRESINFNLFACEEFYQGRYSANFIRNYLKTHQERIMEYNRYKNRYNKNDDVFLHVRLGDVVDSNPGYDYYEGLLETLKPFQNGYIASDSIDHEICKKLIHKHDLIPIVLDPTRTIMFGSTCKHIILSMGSYSWMIGAMGYFSNVFFPNFQGKPSFCPYELFDFPDWHSVDYELTPDP
jgi:hypothetical protein